MLVASSFGRIDDFAVGSDTLYPIVNLGGYLQLVACPGFVCGASPHVIGRVSADTYGRGVAIAGNSIFWIGLPDAGTAQLMQADLDGSNVRVRATFATADLEPPLRSDGSTLYFTITPHYATSQGPAYTGLTYAMPADSGDPFLLDMVSATDSSVLDRLDVHAGKLAAHHPALSGGAATPVYVLDLATYSVTTVGSVHDAGALAVAATATFFTDADANPEELYGCSNDACQGAQAIAPTGFAAATDDAHVYYPDLVNATWTISSCDITAAMAGTCTPTQIVQPTSGSLDFWDLRAMQVVNGALYVSGDAGGGAALWRIKL